MTPQPAAAGGPAPGAKRVLVVDGHPIFREALAARLAAEPDLGPVGQAGDVAGGARLLAADPPDLAVVELALRDGSGLRLVAQAAQATPPVPALVLSGLDEAQFAAAAVEAGASGFVGKHEPADVVVQAVRHVLSGRSWVPAGVLDQLVRPAGDPEVRRVRLLSARERQVFELIGDGRTAKQVAAHLGMSVHTVDTHRERIKRKLGVGTGAALTRLAIEWRVGRRTSADSGRIPRR